MRIMKTLMTKSNEIIFSYPSECDDYKEKDEMLKMQIFNLLVKFSNDLQNYDSAIAIVNGYLKALIINYPEDKEWIKKIAEEGGQLFVESVGIAQRKNIIDKVERGECIIQPKDIKGGD